MPGEVWRVGEVIDGRYAVTGVHESGGMGLVYRVRHLEWQTDLAVKSPRPELLRTRADRDRFVHEADAWVRLGLHPHVCSCYYVRTLGGIPRVFAEYLPGGTLREWIADGRLYRGGPARAGQRILDVAIQTAWGLAHAHRLGLVHQDVKAANVLFDAVTADTDDLPTAKVTDFGLARAGSGTAGPSAATTGTGTILVPTGGLTPAYASPEQAAGSLVGRRSDVWSLAVAVLEMFTGGVTWAAGPAAGAALADHLATGTRDPRPPRMPAEVADLLRRCLRRDPEARPKTMGAVADELVAAYHVVTGRTYPRPTPATVELRPDELNNRALSLLDLGRTADAGRDFAAALAAAPHHPVATYNTTLVRWRRGELTDLDAVAAMQDVRADEDSPLARALAARVHRERGDLQAAHELLAGLPAGSGEGADLRAELAGLPVRELQRTSAGETLAVAAEADGVIWCRGRLRRGGARALTANLEGSTRVWDTATGRCLWHLPGFEPTRPKALRRAADLSPDGRRAVTFDLDTQVLREWDLAAGTRTLAWDLSGINPEGDVTRKLSTLQYTAGGRAVACWSRDDVLRVLDLADGTWRHRLDGAGLEPEWGVFFDMVSADGGIALFHSTRAVLVWDLAANRCLRRFAAHSTQVDHAILSADGRHVLSTEYDAPAVYWERDTGRVLATLTGAGRWPLVLDAARGLALIDEAAGVTQLWDLRAPRLLRTFTRPGGSLSAHDAYLAPAGGLVLAAPEQLHRWLLPPPVAAPLRPSRPRSHGELTVLESRRDALIEQAERAMSGYDPVRASALLAQVRTLPGHERSATVRAAWRRLDGLSPRAGVRAAWLVRTLTGHRLRIWSVAMSHDAATAVTGGAGACAQVWDLDTGTCRHTLNRHQIGPGPQDAVIHVGLSADGRIALTLTNYGRLLVWRTDTGTCLRTLYRDGSGPAATAVSLSPDGTLALVGFTNGVLTLTDVGTGARVRTLTGPGSAVVDAWLSLEHALAAAATHDGTVWLWDLDTGRARPPLTGHTSPVRSVCVSSDGRRVLSGGGDDRSLRIWDVATGQPLRVLDDTRHVSRARFTVNRRFAVCAQLGSRDDQAVRIWDVETGQCLRSLEDRPVTAYDLALTPDGRRVLVPGSDGTLRLWELEWDLDPREPADWDEAAAPYLDAFLRTHVTSRTGDGRPGWAPHDEQDLLRVLADAGYGWLRPDGVRAALRARTERFGPSDSVVPLIGSSPLDPGRAATGPAAPPPTAPAPGAPEPPIML